MTWLVPTMLMTIVGHSMQTARQSTATASAGIAALSNLLSDAATGVAETLRSAAQANQAPIVSGGAWDWGMLVFAGVLVVASMLSAIVHSREDGDRAGGQPRAR